MGGLFHTAVLGSKGTADNSAKGQASVEESRQKAEKRVSSKVEDVKEGTKTAQAGSVKESQKTANKDSESKDKRQIAGTAYNCSEFWTNEFSAGYIQVGAKCASEDSLCLAFFHVARNYCEESHLIRYYCDPKQPSLFSTEKIKCEKSCEFSGLSGVCVK